MEKNDAELIVNYLDGDQEALKTLISRHIKLVYNFTYRISGNTEDANDITQETFLKVWKNLKRYDPQRKFSTWLLAIARNTALDWLKKKRAFSFSEMDGDEDGASFEENVADGGPLADEIFEKKEIALHMENALAQVPIKYKDIIVFHMYQNLTFKEIADIIGKPLNTVKSSYRRGVMILKKYVTMHQND